MKTRLLIIFVLAALVLAACGAAAPAPTQVPPTEAPTAVPTVEPTAAPTTAAEPTVAPTAAPAAAPAAGSEVKITISSFKFDPATVTVKVGDTVTWMNEDSAGHTVVADDGSWASNDLAKGVSFSFKFDKAGTYTYICGVHPSMKGTVVVQ